MPTPRKFTVALRLPNLRQPGDVPLPISEVASYRVLYQDLVGDFVLGVSVNGPFTQRDQTSPPIQPDHEGAVNFRVIATDQFGQDSAPRESGLSVPSLPPLPDAPDIVSTSLI